jgi:hypothetical protein
MIRPIIPADLYMRRLERGFFGLRELVADVAGKGNVVRAELHH